MNENTKPSPTTNSPIPEQLTLNLVQASIAAYQVWLGQTPTLPAGWTQVATVTGWVDGYPQGHAEMFGLLLNNSNDTGQYIIAFRGTNTDADAFTELFCIPTPFVADNGSTPPDSPEVGAGFFKIYSFQGKSMAVSMQRQLFALLSQYSPTQLYITGHSLGGALGEMLALDLSVCSPSMAVTTITFAAPMVGIQSWGQSYANGPGASTTRVVNQFDIVPKLPPAKIAPNYVQVGTEFDVAFQPQTTGLPEKEIVGICHATTNYQYVLQQALPATPQQWAGTFPDTSGVGQNITDVSTYPS